MVRDFKKYEKYRFRWISLGSLVALLVGLILGILGHAQGQIDLQPIVQAVTPVQTLWTDALRLVVIPLIISYLIVAISSATASRKTGRIAGLAMSIHAVLMFAVAALFVLIIPGILVAFPVNPEAISAFTASGTALDSRDGLSVVESFLGIRTDSFTGSILLAVANVDVVLLLASTIGVALLVSRLESTLSSRILRTFEAVARGSLILIDWLLLMMPAVVFSVTLSVAMQVGQDVVGILGYFILLASLLLLSVTAALYLVVWKWGKIPITRFAKAAGPIQSFAAITRSSLLCLPMLVHGARNSLAVPKSVTGIVLPLSVSTFKLNMMVTEPLRLFFLAHVYGVVLDPVVVGSLVVAAMISSLGTPGIPSGGGFTTLPILLSAGIPIEGVVLVQAIDTIPDIFKTIVNVTEDLSVTVLVSKFLTVK